MEKALKTLKKYLIPHDENGHRPHLLRSRTVVFIIMVVFVAESAFLLDTSYLVPRSKLFGVILVNALVDGTNSARAANDLVALRTNPLLQAAAQEKADDMVKNNYFAHTSPAGISPWYWFSNVGYDFTAAGENLAVNFSDSADVTNAWMNSPGHRANILNGGFTEIGMATAQGTFEGRPAVYVVEMFGAPAVTAVSIPTAIAAAPKSAAKPAAKPPVAAATGNDVLAVVKGVNEVISVATGTPSIPSVAVPVLPVQAAAADPRATVNLFYFVLAAIFAAALVLNIFIKVRIQHPALIMGGIAVIAVVGVFIILNHQLVLLHAAVV